LNRAEFPVRVLLNLILAGLIIACPAVCGAGEAGHDAHRPEAADSQGDPVHCPQDGDACICEGAVPTNDVQVPTLDTVALPFFVALVHGLAHPIPHLTWNGSPTGLAGWGDSLTVRALLQNFRC